MSIFLANNADGLNQIQRPFLDAFRVELNNSVVVNLLLSNFPFFTKIILRLHHSDMQI